MYYSENLHNLKEIAPKNKKKLNNWLATARTHTRTHIQTHRLSRSLSPLKQQKQQGATKMKKERKGKGSQKPGM